MTCRRKYTCSLIAIDFYRRTRSVDTVMRYQASFLVAQVSPKAEPPVCRFQNFGKAQYAAKLRDKVRCSS